MSREGEFPVISDLNDDGLEEITDIANTGAAVNAMVCYHRGRDVNSFGDQCLRIAGFIFGTSDLTSLRSVAQQP
jgi:hypothetical protein